MWDGARRLSVFALLAALTLAACGKGAAATGGTGGATSSASSSASSTAGTGGGASPCGAPDLHVDGTLAGAPVSAVFATSHVVAGGTPAETDLLLCDGGDVFLFSGAAGAATALFRMPAPGPHAGEWFCAGAGTTAQVDGGGGVQATLAGLSSLGACPGQAGPSMVSGCVGAVGSGACLGGVDSVVSGTIAGAMFSWSAPVATSLLDIGPQPGTLDLVLGGDAAGGKLLLDLAADPDDDDQDFKVLGGVLLMGAGGPDPGAVYCVDGGNVNVGGTPTFTLTALSRLGVCGAVPAGGSLTLARAP